MSQSAHCKAFVSVTKWDSPGNIIFVIVEDRSTFDLIDLPMTDHGPRENGHVLSKSIQQASQHLVFQFWIEKPRR